MRWKPSGRDTSIDLRGFQFCCFDLPHKRGDFRAGAAADQAGTRPRVPLPAFLAEIRNAFNMAIGRGEIGEAEREAVIADIERQIEAGFFRMADVSQADIYAKASELSDHHTPAMLTRSLDLMHVAAALLCKARVFLSTDTRQRTAAKAEGLEVKQ